MKYVQPLGISDPNASYIDGNPNTGTKGSAVPAGSLENPQREIINFITKSALTPTGADLFQLAKAVQTGLVNYGTDNGVPNQIAITPVVPISAYALGQRFVIKVGYGNTSFVTVNISGIGAVPLIHIDQTPINPYELILGQLIEVAYDGANFQAIGGLGIGGAVLMTAPHDIYVNASTGSDTLYDGTSAVVSGTSGPFQTIVKALATMQKYNLGGWTFTIHVADGVYTATTPTNLPMPNGSGAVALVGNTTNPAAVSIFNTGTGSCWKFNGGGIYSVNGFSFRATAPAAGDGGNCIWVSSGSFVTLLGNNSFGSTATGSNGCHLLVGPSASASIIGTINITGPAAFAHHWAISNGVSYNSIPEPALVVTTAVSIPSFSAASNGGQTRETWASFTGASNVTGSKYNANGNGVIDSAGRGSSYLPGTTAGVLATGGQYI